MINGPVSMVMLNYQRVVFMEQNYTTNDHSENLGAQKVFLQTPPLVESLSGLSFLPVELSLFHLTCQATATCFLRWNQHVLIVNRTCL